jgi:hypothetical protein
MKYSSRVSLLQPHEGSPRVREVRIDFDSNFLVLSGDEVHVTVQVDEVFRAYGFIPTETNPLALDHWMLEGLVIRQVENVVVPMPLDLLAGETMKRRLQGLDGPLLLPTASPGMSVLLRVRNLARVARRLRVAAVGISLEREGK